jgi:hypothetical protein
MNFQITTELNGKLSYTPCYNQYGKVAQMFDWNIEQKLLKMWGGNFKIEYLYIKKSNERFETIY